MSERDKKIEQQISNLTQNESFQQTEKILTKLKKEVVDGNENTQITTLLNNLEYIKTAESNKIIDQIDTIYNQLIQIKTLETFELTEEEVASITQLTEVIGGIKIELFELKEEIVYTGQSTLDRNDDELDEDIDMGYTGNSPLDNKTRKPLIDVPKGSGKELFTQKDAFKRGGRALVGLGGFLGIRRLRKKMKARKEKRKAKKANNNTETTKDNTDKPKKKGFFGKLLKWAGIGGGVYTGYKFLTGDWTFQKLRDWLKGNKKGSDIVPVIDNEEEAAKSFEDLLNGDTEAKEKAKQYTNIGVDINKFSDDIYSFSDGTINKPDSIVKLGDSKDKYTGAIPYVLDNSYENIGNMTTELSLFQLMARSTRKEIIKAIKMWITEGVDEENILVKGTLKILGFSSLKEFQDGGENKISEAKVDEVNVVFQKILKIMSYMNFAKNAYIMEQIKGKTIQKKAGEDSDGDTIWKTINNNIDPSKGTNTIQDILDDPESYRVLSKDGEYTELESITEDFNKKHLSEIADVNISLNDIKIANPEIYEDIDKVNKKRTTYHKEINDGKGTEVMNDLGENCEDLLANSIFKSLTNAMPITTLLELTLLGSEENLKKEYMKNSGFKKLVQSYKYRFENSKKLDKNEQKTLVDEYLTLVKEIETTTAGLQANVDDQGNYSITIYSTFSHLIGNTKHAFTTGFTLGEEAFDEYGDGNYGKGSVKLVMSAFYIAGGVGVSAMALGSLRYLTSWGKQGGKLAKAGRKISTSPISIPAYIARKHFKVRTLRHTISSNLPTIALKKLYNTPGKLSNALKNGLRFSKAYDIYAFNKQSSNISKSDFFKEMFGTKNTDANNVLSKYLFDGDQPANEADIIWGKFRKKFINTTPQIFKTNKFTLSDKFLNELKPLAKQIDDPEILRHFAKNLSLKNMNKISKIFTDTPDILKLLNNTSDLNTAKAISSQIIYNQKDGITSQLDNLKAIAKGSQNSVQTNIVRSFDQLTETEKKLSKQINNSISEVDKAIKKAKQSALNTGNTVKYKINNNIIDVKVVSTIDANNIKIETRSGIEYTVKKSDIIIDSQLMKGLENHKKGLEKIIKNISSDVIDSKALSVITDLFEVSKNNLKVEKNLIRHLGDESSEIHDAIKGLSKSGNELKDAEKTIKKLLGASDDMLKELKPILKRIKLVGKSEKVFKGVVKILKYA